MMRLRLEHVLRCDVETFWRTFFDGPYNQALYVGALGFERFTVREQREMGSRIVRVVEGMPKLALPGALAKLVGPSLTYVEEGTFEKAAHTYAWTMRTSALGEKLRNEGVLRTEAERDGRCRRVVELVAEAKLFGLGGAVEAANEKQLRDGWEASARFLDEVWLARP